MGLGLGFVAAVLVLKMGLGFVAVGAAKEGARGGGFMAAGFW